jgi:hypothetical protein
LLEVLAGVREVEPTPQTTGDAPPAKPSTNGRDSTSYAPHNPSGLRASLEARSLTFAEQARKFGMDYARRKQAAADKKAAEELEEVEEVASE